MLTSELPEHITPEDRVYIDRFRAAALAWRERNPVKQYRTANGLTVAKLSAILRGVWVTDIESAEHGTLDRWPFTKHELLSKLAALAGDETIPARYDEWYAERPRFSDYVDSGEAAA